MINTLKFLGLVDAENARTDPGVALFSTHGEAFAPAFESIIREKYAALFEIRGDEAWNLDRDALISFFRGTDKTSATVGARQALTFSALASMASKREAAPRVPSSASTKAKLPPKAKSTNYAAKPAENSKPTPTVTMGGITPSSDMSLTVRIEINLPANGSQATYDNIFKSIRENLLNQNA